MRTSEIDILIIPGWTNSGPDHWQSRWQRHLKTARRVEQTNWDQPICTDWVANIVAAVRGATRPAVLVAHSCGVAAVAHAAPLLGELGIAGAFLVAPADLDGSDEWPHGGFAPTPMDRFPFPSRLIGSSSDPHCSVERAKEFAAAWGSNLSIVANAGHINTASGHGPWPEGLLTFGLFLKSLGPAA
ncbi:MAG: alpha/beta hydrolase [Hyphomicrobiaceae bacterium]|jgi:predicted alpha/beta hydrolase family esterase